MQGIFDILFGRTHTHTHTHIHTYIHNCAHIDMHTCINTYTHMRITCNNPRLFAGVVQFAVFRRSV